MKEKFPPPNVRAAQERGDKEALAAMGKKGAEHSAQIRTARALDKKEAKAQELADAAAHEAATRAGWDEDYDPADDDIQFPAEDPV